MPTVASILKNKPSHVVTIGPNATALDAAQRMNQHRIGCLVVADPRGGRVVVIPLTAGQSTTSIIEKLRG